jgi:hypothetical protein
VKLPLMEFAQAVADANGRAVATAGPDRFGDRWDISLMNTNTNSTSQTELRVYRGVESESARILGTYAANSDTASGSTITVMSGDKLVFVWSNADPGSICTVRIEGDFHSGRR